jgi:hypothetical protein
MIKLKHAVAIVVVCGTAAADPVLVENNIPAPPKQEPHAISLDVAATVGRVDLPAPGTSQITHGWTEGFRFAPQISFAQYVYVTVGIDVAHINAHGPRQVDSGEMSGGDGGTTSSGSDPGQYSENVALGGYTAQITGAIGGHFFEGPVSLGAELGIGERLMHVADSCGAGCEEAVGADSYTTVYPLRVRADFFATPRLAVGAMAEIDIDDRHYYDGGIVLSFHVLPYDLAR